MQYVLKFHLMMIFLLANNVCTKFVAAKNFDNARDDLNSVTDDYQLGIEDEIADDSENYKSRQKFKEGTDHDDLEKRYSYGNSWNDNQQPKPACAVMYKNNEPVGVLQPFEDSYKFLPISGEPTLVDISPIPVKRNSIMDELYPSKIDDEYDDEKEVGKVGYADDKFPSVLAKFKIDSKLEKAKNQGINSNLSKRAPDNPSLDNQRIGSLKSTLSKMKSDDSEAVEEELRNILDEMGLIEEYPEKQDEKREAEDENLETGTNKINLIKEEHTETRIKRDDIRSISANFNEDSIASSTLVAFINSEPKMNENEIKIERRAATSTSPSDIKVEEKREGGTVSVISFLDSLASTPNLSEDQLMGSYEKRIEREIRDKIQRLKDEVKKEIDALKSDQNEVSKKSEKSRRKKRQIVNNLMNEETQDIDPNLNSENSETVHVRRKRSFDNIYEMPDKIRKYFDSIRSVPLSTDNPVNNRKKQGKRTYLNIINNMTEYRGKKLQQGMATTKYYGKLKQYNFDDKLNVNDYNSGNRKKREIDADDMYGGEYDESEFANDIEIQNTAHEEREKKESDAHTPSKQNCQCDKNGCKCGANEYPNLMADQKPSVESGSIGKRRCNCGTQSNCDCGKALESSVLDENSMETKDFENNPKINVNGEDESKLRYVKRNIIGYIDPVAYVPSEENEENSEYDEYDTDSMSRLKRDAKPKRLKSFENGEYFLDLHPQMYRLSPINNVEAFHGGGKKGKKRRRQSSLIPSHFRARRGVLVDREEPRQLTDMSEEEIFGALPQSYEGELARFKRVKRSKTGK